MPESLTQTDTSESTRPPTRTGWLDSRRSILAVGAVLVLISGILFLVTAEANRRATLRDAEQTVNTLVGTLVEHAGRILDISNLVADQAIELTVGHDWDQLSRSPTAQAALRGLGRKHDFINAIWLVDSTGAARLTSRWFPSPTQSVADRPHFRVQIEEDVGPYLSPMLQSRVVNEVNMVVSRRITGPDGEFRGVVLIVLNPNEFERVYRGVRARYPVTIELFRNDRTILLRHPDGAASGERTNILGTDYLGVPLFGAHRGGSSADTVGEISTFRAVGSWPLFVGVRISYVDVVSRWLSDTTEGLIVALAMLGIILLFVFIAAARCGSEAIIRGKLEALNATLENRIKDRTATIERLMREVNHRAKNSLQTVSSLLHMHALRSSSPEVRADLAEARNRVMTLARVHDRLYRTDHTPTVKLDALLSDIGDDLAPTLITLGGASVNLNINARPIELDIDNAVPLMLVVNELITNAVKYGFPDRRTGNIWVTLWSDDERIGKLSVDDDGIGLPTPFDPRASTGLGMTLVLGLVNQVGGELEYGASPKGGARFLVTFPLVRLKAVDPTEAVAA